MKLFKEKEDEIIKNLLTWKEELIECNECKCLIRKSNANRVKILGFLVPYYNFYCNKCNPNYNEIIYCGGELRYYKNNQTVEVDKKGEVIKKTK